MFWNVGRGIKQKVFFWDTEDQMFKSTQIEVGWKKKGVHIQMCSFCWRVDIPIFDFGIVDQFDNTRLLQLLSAITLLIPRPPTCTQHTKCKTHNTSTRQITHTMHHKLCIAQNVLCQSHNSDYTLKLSLVELHEVTNNTICRSYWHLHTM